MKSVFILSPSSHILTALAVEHRTIVRPQILRDAPQDEEIEELVDYVMTPYPPVDLLRRFVEVNSSIMLSIVDALPLAVRSITKSQFLTWFSCSGRSRTHESSLSQSLQNNNKEISESKQG